jgi:3-oxoacyl-[acyl-carrier protein] reductase
VRSAAVAGAPARPEISLANKVVLVTGGSTGIGRAIALASAEAGADVLLTYRTRQRQADEVTTQIRGTGRRAQTLQADMTNGKDIERLGREAKDAFGRVDAWINNAGADVLTGKTSKRSRTEKLDLLLAVDLRGTVLASWTAVELMRAQATGGVILNMSWDQAVGASMKGEYAQLFCAAKGGIAGFSRALAQSVAPHIRVNALGPGWVETSYGAALDPKVKTRVTESIPLRRWGSPEDVAAAAVFLCSDAAAYVTGQILMINGGAVM